MTCFFLSYYFLIFKLHLTPATLHVFAITIDYKYVFTEDAYHLLADLSEVGVGGGSTSLRQVCLLRSGGICPMVLWEGRFPSLLWREWQTDVCENVTFLQLHLQAVNIKCIFKQLLITMSSMFNHIYTLSGGRSLSPICIVFMQFSAETMPNKKIVFTPLFGKSWIHHWKNLLQFEWFQKQVCIHSRMRTDCLVAATSISWIWR